jgi:hypothetical protein
LDTYELERDAIALARGSSFASRMPQVPILSPREQELELIGWLFQQSRI